MEIGILTLPFNTNYGGILQAWALKIVLERLGHDVSILQNNNGNTIRSAISSVIRRIYPGKRQLEQKVFKNFIDKNINKLVDVNALRKDNCLDAIIVGSDQVWRSWGKYWLLPYYFLDFAKDWNIKRYSYAASFGVDTFVCKSEEKDECIALAKQFDGISVREDDGIRICKEYFSKESIHVLDPTMLLDKNDYLSLLGVDANKSTGLVTYFLGNEKKQQDIMLALSSDYGQINAAGRYAMKRHFITKYKCWSSVEYWVETMAGAEFILTNSFHGTAFAINFEKPFIVLPNSLGGQPRINSILNMFGLQDRIAITIEDAKSISKKTIDWEKVRMIKESMRKVSLDFLCKI